MSTDSLLTVGENVSVKAMPSACENSRATSLALKCSIEPSLLFLTLRIHLDPIG